jgi:hypothetical protein
MLLLISGRTKIFFTHHEADTLGIVETGSAGLDLGPTLLELADDGLIALLAVNMAEKLAIDAVLAFAEVTIRDN